MHEAADAMRQQAALPRSGRSRKTLQAFQRATHRIRALGIRGTDLVPVEQEPHVGRRRHRLDLLAQALDGVTIDPREQSPLAPFLALRLRPELSAHYKPF